MSAALDYATGGEAAYTGGDAWGVLPGDTYDAAHLAPFVPPLAQEQGMAGWEALIRYGITRAIDNRYGPPNLQGNTNAGTFAGQSGATIGHVPGRAGGGIARPGASLMPAEGGGGMLLLVAAAAVAALAFAG